MPRILPVASSRALARVHRTLGSALALLLVIWFLSGAVMLFHGYPYAALQERLAVVPALGEQALRGVERAALEETLRAGQRLRIYLGPDGAVVDGVAGLRDARGNALRRSSPSQCLAHARTTRPQRALRFAETVSEVGQWTVPESIRSRLPLYRYETPEGEHLYLDPVGCGLVQQSTSSERVWAYFGAIPHWVYLAPLRMHRQMWRWLVITLSLLGLVTCLTGLLRGASLLRRPKRSGGGLGLPTSPMRKPLLRFHHPTGLLFGTVASTWLLSGAMSLSPIDLSPTGVTQAEAARRFSLGAGVQPIVVPPSRALFACQRQLSAVHLLELFSVGGAPYYVCYGVDGTTALVNARDAHAQEARPRLARGALSLAAEAVLPGELRAFVRMRQPDAYYYPRHGDAHHERDIYRASFADADETALYLSPTTGRLLRHQARGLRLERWLYHGLHSLDFPLLYRHSTLWYAVMLSLLAGGALLSLSALVLSRRVIRRALRRAAARRRGGFKR